MTTTILPPTPTTTLLEPSFVDLIAAIERSDELSAEHRRHWVCSLRQIAKARPPGRGHPRPLVRDPNRGRPIALRPHRRHGQDRGQP